MTFRAAVTVITMKTAAVIKWRSMRIDIVLLSTNEANGAGQSIFSNQQISFDQHVGAFDVHRQPERDESRARHLHADHFAALHWLLIAAVSQRKEIGGVLAVLRVSGHAVDNEWFDES